MMKKAVITICLFSFFAFSACVGNGIADLRVTDDPGQASASPITLPLTSPEPTEAQSAAQTESPLFPAATSSSSMPMVEADAEYRKILPDEAKSIIDEDENCIILDVRTEQEYNTNRIEGAVLIPHTEINSRAADELTDKDAVILVYCRSGVILFLN